MFLPVSYLLQQPNGLLAYYSTISDEFEYWNLSLDQALVVVWRGGGPDLVEAAKILVRALRDETVQFHDNDGLPNHRWRAALESAHKSDALARVKAEATAAARIPIDQEMVDKLLAVPDRMRDLQMAKVGQLAEVGIQRLKLDLLGEIGLFDVGAWSADALDRDLLAAADDVDRDGLQSWFEFFDGLYRR